MTAAQELQRLLTVEERARRAELEAQVRVGAAAAVLAGRALTAIRDEGLYRDEFTTFEAYTLERFGMSRQRAYQLIDYAEAAHEFEARGLTIPPERITRALGGVVPDDYQIVLDVTKAMTGKDKPSSADVAAVAEVARDMAAGMQVEHPQTREPTSYAALPPAERGPALRQAVQRKAQDRREFQGTDDVKPWVWLDGLRQSGSDVQVLGTADGWQIIVTDRLTGEQREGPQRKGQWDAIRAARAVLEGELNQDD